jgi:hypothetical protein
VLPIVSSCVKVFIPRNLLLYTQEPFFWRHVDAGNEKGSFRTAMTIYNRWASPVVSNTASQKLPSRKAAPYVSLENQPQSSQSNKPSRRYCASAAVPIATNKNLLANNASLILAPNRRNCPYRRVRNARQGIRCYFGRRACDTRILAFRLVHRHQAPFILAFKKSP